MEKSIKILIVDDDQDIMNMYGDVFQKANFDVLYAHDGVDGLDVATKEIPDVIFTGIIMPRMDGFDLIEALKKNVATHDIPILINSHLGREQDQERAYDLGVKDFIVLDFTSPQEVVKKIKGLFYDTNEYILEFNPHTLDAPRLIADSSGGNFFACPKNEQMVLRLSSEDMKKGIYKAEFICPNETRAKMGERI